MVKRVEAAIQRAVIAYIRKRFPHVKIAASQNENSRHAASQGMDIGEPDLRLLWRTGGVTHLLYLELKTKKGRLSPSQIAWNADFDANYSSDNCTRAVAYGLDDACHQLKNLLTK